MNIKDLFDKAENGTLTYEQFTAAANEANAKFADLSEGNYVAKQKYADETSTRDTRISTLEETLKTRETDLSNLQKQLEEAGTDAESLNRLNTTLTTLQSKYDKDTKALQKQLKEQEYRFAATEFANGLKFTSEAAKRDFTSQLLAKNFEVENGKIIGASDFKDAYTTANADALVVEKEPEAEPAKPQFTASTSPTGGESGNTNPFNFDFIGVRKHE